MVKTKLKNRLFVIGISLISIVMVSCKGEDIYFQKYVAIENSAWNMDNPVSFEFEITDTVSVYNFSFNLRNTSDYRYSNFFLFWELKSPDGRTKNKTSEFILAKPNGQWLGNTSSGTLIENSMVFLKKKLPVKGKYTFTFTQGMRDSTLNNIQDVGLKIIKANEQNK